MKVWTAMIFLEINEFSPELMRHAAEMLNAKNLLKLLSLHNTKTITDDQAERHGLDPWVQWVSIHTGQPSASHGIKHLGDTRNLKHRQTWEILDEAGISYGVWGAMNAHKGKGINCKFFFPDPWTFTENAFPDELNDLLALPRYYSKNYLDLQKSALLKPALKLCRFVLKPTIFIDLLKLIPFVASNTPLNPAKNYLLFVLFDLINTQLFCAYYKRTRPDFALLFLNSLAHLQHHCWTEEKSKLSKEMARTFLIFDKVVELIFSIIDSNETLMITNAFTQKQSYGAKEYLYRQNNPQTFFNDFGLNPKTVEQLMTNDSHLFFDSAKEAANMAEKLRAAKVDGLSAFEVEIDKENPLKLFCQFCIWSDIPEGGKISLNELTEPFYKHFQKVVRRSGTHNPEGDLFSNRNLTQSKIYNHTIFDLVLDHYSLTASK